MENTVNLLAQKSDENEQYSRRSSLRINNIPLPEANKKETSEDVLMKVKEVIAESATIIPDIALDRAHRVGKAFTTEDGKSFTTEDGKSFTTEDGKSFTTEDGKSFTTEDGKSFTTELERRLLPRMGSRLSTELERRLIPQDGKSFTTEDGKSFTTEDGKSFTTELERRLLPRMGSRLLPRMGSRLLPRMGSRLLPRMGSRFTTEDGKSFTTELERRLLPRMGSRLLPSWKGVYYRGWEVVYYRGWKGVFSTEDGTRMQQVVVKFTTWHHRTLFYKNRKKLTFVKVYLDLTMQRFKLLKSCQNKANENASINFVFADVNCSLCARMVDGSFKYFNTMEQFDQLSS